MFLLKRNRRGVSMATLIFFLIFELLYSPAAQGMAQGLMPEVSTPSVGFNLALPTRLGRVEFTQSGTGPSLVHIQTAHGDYEAEQNIRKILHFLKNEYDFKNVFVEGSAFPLEAERLKLFKKHKTLTYQILDQLMRRAFVKGVELFLLEDSEAVVSGIEDVDAYVSNTKAFYEVLKQKESSEQFLVVLNEQIDRLKSVFLSNDLRAFLKQKERYDQKEYDFLSWCEFLRKEALKRLSIDLKDVAYQMDWPMLLRLFKLQDLQQKIKVSDYEAERAIFLKKISKLPKDLSQRIEKYLNTNLSTDHLPNPETIQTFEQMIEGLGPEFSYDDYPQVKFFITHLILQSELDAVRLQDEIENLFMKIANSMMDDDQQKSVFDLYRQYELLTHLFGLQLTPREYEELLKRGATLAPHTLFETLQMLNEDNRTELLDFKGMDSIQKLFDKSFEFYIWAKKRDEIMLKNVDQQMRERNVEKAVVITGGFHAEPFREFFKENSYNYALVSPAISSLKEQNNYVDAMLQTLKQDDTEVIQSTLESIPFVSLPSEKITAMGYDPDRVSLALLDVVYAHLSSVDLDFSPQKFNDMVKEGGALDGLEINFINDEAGQPAFEITFSDGRKEIVGQKRQVAVRETIGFDLTSMRNTPRRSTKSTEGFDPLPSLERSPALSSSSRAELRSVAKGTVEFKLRREKPTVVVGSKDPRDKPLKDLNTWNQLFGHRFFNEGVRVSLRDLFKEQLHLQNSPGEVFRSLDIGTGNGKFLSAIKRSLTKIGFKSIQAVGVESDPKRWGFDETSVLPEGYEVSDFLKLDKTHPQLMQEYDLITLNAPQLLMQHQERESNFEVRLNDFSLWLNQIKKIMKKNGRVIIRLYQPEDVVSGSEVDWLHIESALLESVLKDSELEHIEVGAHIEDLPKGSMNLGPAIIVQFKSDARSELRQFDEDEYKWIIPPGTLPENYELRGKTNWNLGMGHRRSPSVKDITFLSLVASVLENKENSQQMSFVDMGTGDGTFVSALKRSLEPLNIKQLTGIGIDRKGSQFLEADLIEGKTYFQFDFQDPEAEISGIEASSQDFVFMNAPQLIRNTVSAGRNIFLSVEDFSIWLKHAKTILSDDGYLVIRLFEDSRNVTDFQGDWMKIESYLFEKFFKEDGELNGVELGQGFEDLPTGSTSLGPVILLQKKPRAELRTDGIGPIRRDDGGIFPEAVRAVTKIAGVSNDPQRPTSMDQAGRDFKISAQAEAYQLFMEFTAEQQPELKDVLKDIVIVPANYEAYEKQHQVGITEAVVTSTEFSEWDIKSVLINLKDDGLLVMGYEAHESDRLSQDLKLLEKMRQEGILSEFSTGQMLTDQYIVIARKNRSELRGKYDEAFKGFAGLPEARTKLLSMIFENINQERSNKVAWYSNSGADIIHPLLVANPDVLMMNDRLNLLASDQQGVVTTLKDEIDALALHPATSEKGLVRFQEHGGGLLVLLMRSIEEMGINQTEIKITPLRQAGKTLDQALKITFSWKHPIEKEAKLRTLYFLGSQSIESLEALPSEVEDVITENEGLDLVIEKAPNYYSDLLAMDLEGLERETATNTQAYRTALATIEAANRFKQKWLKQGGVILGDHEQTEWNSSPQHLTRDYPEDYLNIKFFKLKIYEFFSQSSLSKWGNGSSAIFKRVRGEPSAILPDKNKPLISAEIFKKAFEYKPKSGQETNHAFQLLFRRQYRQGAFDLALGFNPSLLNLDHSQSAIQSLNRGDFTQAILARLNEVLVILFQGFDTNRNLRSIASDAKKPLRFIRAYLSDIEKYNIEINEEDLKAYQGIEGIKTLVEFFDQVVFTLAAVYGILHPEKDQLDLKTIFIRPELTSVDFEEAFNRFPGISSADDDDYKDDFKKMYDAGLFDRILDFSHREAVIDFNALLFEVEKEAKLSGDYTRLLLDRFHQSINLLRLRFEKGPIDRSLELELVRIGNVINELLVKAEAGEVRLNDQELNRYGGALALHSYSRYMRQNLFILAKKYGEARSELRLKQITEDADYTPYIQRIHDIVTSKITAKMAWYLNAGADVFSSLYVTDADTLVMSDRLSFGDELNIPEEGSAEREWLEDYAARKTYGEVSLIRVGSEDGYNLHTLMAVKLQQKGIEKYTIEKISEDVDLWKIDFEWKHPDSDVAKKRTIYFYGNVSSEGLQNLPEEIEGLLRSSNGFDVVIEKAPNYDGRERAMESGDLSHLNYLPENDLDFHEMINRINEFKHRWIKDGGVLLGDEEGRYVPANDRLSQAFEGQYLNIKPWRLRLYELFKVDADNLWGNGFVSLHQKQTRSELRSDETSLEDLSQVLNPKFRRLTKLEDDDRNSQMWIPVALAYIDFFQELAEKGVRADLEGTAGTNSKLIVQGQQLKLHKASGQEISILGYDLLMTTLSPKSTSYPDGTVVTTRSAMFSPANTRSVITKAVTSSETEYIPYIYDDEYPVYIETQITSDERDVQNITAVYVGGLYSDQFLKFEILRKENERDVATPLPVKDIIFSSQKQSTILGPDGKPFQTQMSQNIQKFVEEKALANITVKASFIENPTTRSELRSPEDYRERAKAKARILESEGYQYVLQIVPEDLRKNNGKSAQLSSVREMLSNISTDNRWNENMTQRLTHLTHEILYNLIEHGEGAAFAITFDREGGKNKNIRIAALDSGVGIDDPNVLLNNSTRRKVRSFLEGVEPQVYGGNGFVTYMSRANDVVIESKGKRWQKSGMNHFKESHSDDVPEEGSKLSFTVDLSENVGPIHESYFLHRWTLFRLMKLLSENRWMPFGGNDIDGLTEVLMLSDDDLILKKQELFGEKNDTDRVGIIPTAITTGQYKTLDFKVYQKIIELSLELSNLQRSDFPEHATEQVKVRSEAFIQQWNERYQRQDGKPSREEGHLGVQFARADMEKGPGSIYEFNALRQFANDFLDDRDLPLQNKAETLVADITIILTELKKAGLLTEEMESRLLRNIPILQESAKLYQQRMIGYLPNKEEVLQEYYEAASFTFRVIPTLIESIFRIKKSSEISSMYAIEDGFEVQNETSMHFDIRTGFEYRQREQIGLPNGVNALEHFRENPARVIAAYQYALEKNLSLSHQLRLALIQYQAEFQNWLDSQRLKRKPKESFTEVGRRFLKIMESDQSVMAVLWDMYRSGVLEAVVPELRKVQNLASNFEVHAFTVGQHTLYNLKNFESLRHASGPEPSEGEIIASRLNSAERRQMRLALLFHDLGKRISKTTIEADHAIVSARQIVPKRLKELGATQEDMQAVMWIVRDHMVLNAYAYYFKGDEFETKLPVIKNVIGIDPEASSERLKLLYLISLTDREALNPWLDMLNPDTLTRLNRIYSELEDFLASTGDHERRHDIQALQQMAHEKTRTGWETYKTNKSEGLRSRLENLNSETVKDYLSHMVLINDASLENKLMDRAKQIASDPQVFDELLERLFASFSLNKIRDFRIDQTLRRLLFLIHIQIQKESQNSAPLIYFNPYLSRTYERGYEILVGAGIDTTGFFEKATGVLLLHGFDIEEADIRTLSSGEILDKFHGFFHGDYPDEGAYQKLIEQITKDMSDVLMGVVPSIEALFKRANKPYLSQQSIESIETSVQFLEDENIYGVAASVFNLKTGNRLGLLHALSIIFRRGGYNLVTAPVSTHPSMVNDIFYINKDGRTLTPKEKTDLVEEIRGVVSKRFIVFSDLSASRHELRNSDSDTEASTMSIRVPLAEAIAAIQTRISETESNEVFEELFTNPRLLSELVREYRGRSQRLDSFGLQAGWNKQAVVELVSNAMDWTLAGRGVTPIGRFAIGALQSFELLENEGDYVSWMSSIDGKNAYQLKVILTSEGNLDLELSSPVFYDFERGTRVEISKKGEVWKDYQSFLIKSFGLNTRVPILFVENGSGSILNPLDLQQEREIFLINGSQSEKLAKHFYPDDRIQVQVQDDVLSVRDWGLGMSPKTFLTRLIRPRSGNNENPNKKLTQEQIHQRVKVFYEKQGMIRADERVSSHISLQVAGVEIESVDVTGFNLPHMLAIELPAETNLSTERGNIALDEMTRDSMIATIDKILNLEGAEKIPLLNAMAALLRKWQSKDGKQYEILLNTVQKKIRDWLEVERLAQPNQIVLPNRITLREEEKEEGQYFNEDAFQYLSLNADDEVIYLDDILFPFDPKKISKFKRVSNWYSNKGYQVWIAPFEKSSNEIYFLHQNYIVVNEEHYHRHANNPAVLTQHINPILDYVPEGLKTGRLRGHFILRQEKKTRITDAPAPQQKTDTEWDILEGLKGYLIKQGLTAEQAQERIVSARRKTEEIIRENGLDQTPLFADSDPLASYDFYLGGYGALFNFLILYPDEMVSLQRMSSKIRDLVKQDFFTLHDAGQIIYDYVMSYGAGSHYQKALTQVLEIEEREKVQWVLENRKVLAQGLARAGYFFHAEFLARDALVRMNVSPEADFGGGLPWGTSDLERVGLIRVLMGDDRDPLELWEYKETDNYWHAQKEVVLQMLREGDLDRALAFTRRIQHTSAGSGAYEGILNFLYQQKDLAQYKEVLLEYESFVNNLNLLREFMESSVNFDYAKASMSSALSSFYRRINENEKALQIEQEGYRLGSAQQTTYFFEEFYIELLRGRTLNDDDFQSEGFLSLDGFRQANVLIAAKEWERAKQVIASLEGRYVYTKSMDLLAGQIETSNSSDEIQDLMDEIFDQRFNDELDGAALSVLKAAVIRFAELGKLEGSYTAVESRLLKLKSKGNLYGRDYERFVEPVLEKLVASEDLSNLRVFADKIKNEYPTGAALALIKSASIRVEQNLYDDAQELWAEAEAIASQILPEKKDDLSHVYREMAVVERKLELAGVFSSEKNTTLSEKIENEDLEKINQFLENAYFSQWKHRYQRRINLNMLRLPEPLNNADFSALAPFVTFLDPPLLAIVEPQTVSSLQFLLNSWTMSETEDFFDVINELNPRLIDVERFNTWLFKWATLFNGLRDHDGGLYLMIKRLTKAHSGVFWADEFDATHLPESIQDAALLMIVHYLRSGESESLLEEVSSIDDFRSQVSETNRRLERFSVAEINAIYNAELSQSAGDVDPRTNWKKIKSMSDYLDYRSRIKPIHDRDLDILSMQINKAIEGQDNSPDISQRELIQNSLKAHAQAKIKEPIVVRSFIRKGAKHEWVKSVADNAGMELQDILGPLLVLDERAEITEADMSRGFFGIGFFTTFKDFDRVRLITSKGKGFPVYYLEIWRDPQTKRIQVSIEENENDREYRGTIVEGIKEVDPNQNPIAQFIMANDNLLRYVAAVQDTPIIFNGKPINEVLQTMGKVNTAFGELRLSTSLSGRKRVVLNGLFVESPEHENYFALVPKVYRDILLQSGITLELPEEVSLTSSRNTLAKKEEVLPEIQRAVALASYQMIINLFLYDNVYPLGLTQDYLGESDLSVDADVAQDAALIKQGLFNQVNFSKYVAAEEALENEKMIKNRKMIELLTVIEVDERANPGFKTSLDHERLKVLGKKEGAFSGTSLTAKYYAEHGKALSERQNDFKPYAPEVLNQPRLQAFITLGDVLLEMMGESGVAIVLGESTTKDIPAFFSGFVNTISWDLAMTEIERLTTHFYRIVAGESFDAEDLYSFFYHYTDILFHEAAHVYSGSHQREKMEGLFGWYKDQLLKKFLLNQTSLEQVVEEVRKRLKTKGFSTSGEALSGGQKFLGLRAELRVNFSEDIKRLRSNINDGLILGMNGKAMLPEVKEQILKRLNEIEASANNLDDVFKIFEDAEKMSEFQRSLKGALIEEYPDLQGKLFFISRNYLDGFIAWLLISPVFKPSDLRGQGVWGVLVNKNNAEQRPFIFVGADYDDLRTLFVTAHEVAHFLQQDTDGISGVAKLQKWLVEGYQKQREMEVVMSLYKRSEKMGVAIDKLYRNFSQEQPLPEEDAVSAGDTHDALTLEKIAAMGLSVASGYLHETIFVEALIAKLGEADGHEALRDIHQTGDYTKLENFLGKEKVAELRAVFKNWGTSDAYPLLEFVLKSGLLSLALYLIEDDFNAEKSKTIVSVVQWLSTRIGFYVNALSDVQKKLLEMDGEALMNSFHRSLWEDEDGLTIDTILSKITVVLDQRIESAALTGRGKLLIALSTNLEPPASEGDAESGDGTRGELRSNSSAIDEYLPKVTLHDKMSDYAQDELIQLVTFVREHNIPDDVLFGRVSDSLEVLKGSKTRLKPFEVPKRAKVIDQVFDASLDPDIRLLITESDSTPYAYDLLIFENATGRLVGASPIKISNAGNARRIMPIWSRTFDQGQGYMQRTIQLLLRSKKIEGWLTESLDDGVDQRAGGVAEMYTRMLATGDFQRINIPGTFNSIIQLDRSELRIFADEDRMIIPFTEEAKKASTVQMMDSLKPLGLVSRGIRFLTPEMYLDIRRNGFLPPNQRQDDSGGIPSRFPDKVSLAISQDFLFRSSATHTYGPFSSFGSDVIPIHDHASFVIDQNYIREHSDEFQLVGRLLDQDESFRREYEKGLDLLGFGDRQVYMKTDVAFPDEIHADRVPGEALGALIVDERLAKKIRQWDEDFNLEKLPLYITTENRYADQLESWKENLESSENTTRRQRAELREALSPSSTALPWYVQRAFRDFQNELFAMYRLADISRSEVYHLLRSLLGREVFAEGFESDSENVISGMRFSPEQQKDLGIIYDAIFRNRDEQATPSLKRGIIDYRQFDEQDLAVNIESVSSQLARQLEVAVFATLQDKNLEYQVWLPENLINLVKSKMSELLLKQHGIQALPENLKLVAYPKHLHQSVDGMIRRLDQRVAFVGSSADLLAYRPHLLRGTSEGDAEAQSMIALLLGEELLKESLEFSHFSKVYRGSDLYEKWTDLMTAFKARLAIMASA